MIKTDTLIILKETENDTESSDEKVTRDNVFDYLFAGMQQDDDNIWGKDKLTFQDPTKNPETGKWEILANNKGGSGSYAFRDNPNGDVEFYDSSGKELRLTVPIEL
ncbi:hypothetical protein [Staphylococcus equorum]|uniref:hypothetical protein n=1 Tax=Staphylococcus equorum TaxID=246432 RepID=UPI001F357D7E|nr:hypothetical protein [Staphylococcus equorum]MCE5007636.1 hypothetical protein [Staphylococcus equorum]